MPTIPGFRTALLKEGAFVRGLEGLAAWPRVPVVLQPSGVVELDAVLGGGFPRGSLVELCGPASSGRTSLSLALLAEATQREEACAFVDVSDSLDPASLAAAGVDIRRLLWIRCGGDEGNDSSQRARSTPAIFSPSKKNEVEGSVILPSAPGREKPTTGSLWQHPRDQMRGIETAIPSLVSGSENEKNGTCLQKTAGPQSNEASAAKAERWESLNGRAEARPYKATEIRRARQRIHGPAVQGRLPAFAPSSETEIDVGARCAGEQAEPDRQRPRRGEDVRRRRFRRRLIQGTDQPAAARGTALRTKPWKRLEQALKATDLLLHAGGWGVVVFDLGSISWVDARRIPLSTWFRFQRILENTPTILLLLGEEPCAKSCASLVLRCQREQEKWSAVVSANGKSGAGSTFTLNTSNEAWSPPEDSPGCNGSGLYLINQSFERQHGQNQSPSETRSGSLTRLGIATFEGFEIQGKVMRSRRQLQPANSARWQTRTLWSGNF